jgi:hypothetical protein
MREHGRGLRLKDFVGNINRTGNEHAGHKISFWNTMTSRSILEEPVVAYEIRKLLNPLSKEEREDNQDDDEESRECANACQVFFDVRVIRIELGATR